jgi:hypothetical protein
MTAQVLPEESGWDYSPRFGAKRKAAPFGAAFSLPPGFTGVCPTDEPASDKEVALSGVHQPYRLAEATSSHLLRAASKILRRAESVALSTLSTV